MTRILSKFGDKTLIRVSENPEIWVSRVMYEKGVRSIQSAAGKFSRCQYEIHILKEEGVSPVITSDDGTWLKYRVWEVDEKLFVVFEDQVGYTPEELEKLQFVEWSEETLKKIHTIKKAFGGEIFLAEKKEV